VPLVVIVNHWRIITLIRAVALERVFEIGVLICHFAERLEISAGGRNWNVTVKTCLG
jgi:hypothetical protein